MKNILKIKLLLAGLLLAIAINSHAQRAVFTEYSGKLNSDQQHYLDALKPQLIDKNYQLVMVDAEAIKVGKSINLPLSDKRNIELIPYDKQTRKDGKVIWKGTSPDYEGSVKFIINGDLVTAGIRLQGASFRLIPLSGGLHLLVPKESFQTKECEMHGQGKVNKSKNFQSKEIDKGDPNNAPEVASAECKVRLLVAFTPAANAASADIGSVIETDVDDFNDINANSNVDFEVELARSVEVTGYVEVNSESLDPLGNGWNTPDNLIRFWHPSDGFMDEIHDLRNLYDADMCQLYTTMLAGAGGFAMDVDVGSADAFCASIWSNGTFTPTHEFGHLIGMWHNTENSPGAVPYAYGHGYYYDGAGTHFRTIMSYSGSCTGGCPRIPNWSNPNIFSSGNATGTAATHDNARVARERDQTIAGFQSNINNKFIFLDDDIDAKEVGDIYGVTSITTNLRNINYLNNSSGSYRAGEEILLTNNFDARAGAAFVAEIVDACGALNKPAAVPPNDVEPVELGVTPTQNDLHVYPNPAAVEATAEYVLTESAAVSFQILDIHGRVVQTLKTKAVEAAGNHQMQLDVSRLTTGVYLCKLIVGNEILFQKIVIE